MYNNINLKILKQFAIENSFLEKNFKINLVNLQNLVISFNQFNKILSFVKSQNKEIYIYISDPYALHFYNEILAFLKKDFEIKNIRIGTKKDLFSYLKINHNVGLIFCLNFSESVFDIVLEKYAFHQNIFLFSGVFSRSYFLQVKKSNKFLFPISINSIKDNILFVLFLLLI